jgi:hypothetical protein
MTGRQEAKRFLPAFLLSEGYAAVAHPVREAPVIGDGERSKF